MRALLVALPCATTPMRAADLDRPKGVCVRGLPSHQAPAAHHSNAHQRRSCRLLAFQRQSWQLMVLRQPQQAQLM